MISLYETIKTNPLFQGIGLTDFESMLACLNGQVRTYPKGSFILLPGDPVSTVGLVVSGCVHVLREDYEGRQNLMASLTSPELFAEVFACAGITHSPVTVTAAEDSEILHIDYRRIITTCSSSCSFHSRLIENMLGLLAEKNLLLNRKMELLSKRTTRERLLLYFEQCGMGKPRFTLPFNRQELADYLCVERSALCAELSRMQRDGLIRYQKNRIERLS